MGSLGYWEQVRKQGARRPKASSSGQRLWLSSPWGHRFCAFCSLRWSCPWKVLDIHWMRNGSTFRVYESSFTCCWLVPWEDWEARASKCKGFEELDPNPSGINCKYQSSLSTELLACCWVSKDWGPPSVVWAPGLPSIKELTTLQCTVPLLCLPYRVWHSAWPMVRTLIRTQECC